MECITAVRKLSPAPARLDRPPTALYHWLGSDKRIEPRHYGVPA